jgi:hypothetical protein
MAWFGRNKEQQAAEEKQVRVFYGAAMAAADSYEVAQGRVEEGDLHKLFGTLRTRHLDFAEDAKKRVKRLGGDPDELTGIMELGGRTITRINAAGSVRDLLISLRQGEENGVAMCREALEEFDLSGKSRSLIEAYNRTHIDNIRDLSEQIALRGTYVGTSAEFYAPQWLRYPKAGFWALEGALVVLGYLFGRSGKRQQTSQPVASPRAQLGGDQAAHQHGAAIEREIGL